MTENQNDAVITHPYSSCIELACRLNTDPVLYEQFRNAMSAGGTAFSTWLTNHGVPDEIAKKIASQSGNELYQTAGEVVCQNFW